MERTGPEPLDIAAVGLDVVAYGGWGNAALGLAHPAQWLDAKLVGSERLPLPCAVEAAGSALVPALGVVALVGRLRWCTCLTGLTCHSGL